MKNRNLLIGLLVLVFGSGLFALTTSGTFRQVAHFPGSGLIAEGVAEGWEYFSQIGNHETADQVIQANVSRTGRPEGDLKSSDALGLNWLSMGPDNFSGRTRSLIIDNRESSGSTLYVGSVAGGLWKSTTRGQTWGYFEKSDVALNGSTRAPMEIFMSEPVNRQIFLKVFTHISSIGYPKDRVSLNPLTVSISPN